MDRVIERIIFISILFSIVFFMHFYSFGRLSSLFGINRKFGYYALIIFLASSIIFSTILCNFYYNPVTRAFYIVSASWFGIQLLLFSAVLLSEIPRLFMHTRKPLLGVMVLSLVAVLSVVSIINAQFVRVRKVEIPSFGKELRAVLLSDLHVGTIWGKPYLERIVARTNALKPDVIFITGDIVSGAAVLRKEIFAPLAELEADTYFVHGNHEHYEGTEEIAEVLEAVGITILNDEETEFNGIELIGIDYRDGDGHAAAVLEKMNMSDDKPTILLTHAPMDPQNNRLELVLAGHTHAGQIFPFNFVVRTRYKFVKGLYSSGKTQIYVTPGTNTWGPPMRLGSRNEITLLELR